MRHCPSCGGIIGRDCFNPVECAQITENLRHSDDYDLRIRVEHLEMLLKKHGINPDEPKQNDGIDDLICSGCSQFFDQCKCYENSKNDFLKQ